MLKLALIAGAGAVGAVLRYLVAGWVQQGASGSFPVGTLSVNVLGCMVIGLLGAVFAGPVVVREEYRLALMVGLLGGFTTFSSFGFETMALLNEGQVRLAIVNVVASNGLGLVAVWIGYRLGERIYGA